MSEKPSGPLAKAKDLRLRLLKGGTGRVKAKGSDS